MHTLHKMHSRIAGEIEHKVHAGLELRAENGVKKQIVEDACMATMTTGRRWMAAAIFCLAAAQVKGASLTGEVRDAHAELRAEELQD